jgi:hypothetical protein
LATSRLTIASGITPITSPPAAMRAAGQRAHQAEPPAAIDDADAAPASAAPTCGPARYSADRRGGGPAVDGEALHARSSIISFAVALALPTTPGMPAPGWVPAPTR